MQSPPVGLLQSNRVRKANRPMAVRTVAGTTAVAVPCIVVEDRLFDTTSLSVQRLSPSEGPVGASARGVLPLRLRRQPETLAGVGALSGKRNLFTCQALAGSTLARLHAIAMRQAEPIVLPLFGHDALVEPEFIRRASRRTPRVTTRSCTQEGAPRASPRDPTARANSRQRVHLDKLQAALEGRAFYSMTSEPSVAVLCEISAILRSLRFER